MRVIETKIVEESEDMRIVREIHEEEKETIEIVTTIQLDEPMNYIRLTVNLD